jgi:hypothetical protein
LQVISLGAHRSAATAFAKRAPSMCKSILRSFANAEILRISSAV